MENTNEYKEYLQNYNFIKELLPKVDEVLGMNQQEEMRLRSCVMMFHSEIEVYIEKICLRILDYASEELKKNIVLPCVAMLCINSEDKKIKRQGIYKAIETVIKNHKNFIAEKNHGIRKEHFENIFKPLGLQKYYDDIFLTTEFFEDLNYLSGCRGVAVHSTMKKFSEKHILPSDLLIKLENINNIILKIDEYTITEILTTS